MNTIAIPKRGPSFRTEWDGRVVVHQTPTIYGSECRLVLGDRRVVMLVPCFDVGVLGVWDFGRATWRLDDGTRLAEALSLGIRVGKIILKSTAELPFIRLG